MTTISYQWQEIVACAHQQYFRPLPKHKLKRIMTLSLTEGRMTISIDFGSSDEQKITTEEVLIGAYDIISRVFSQEQVIRAYYNTNPDTMTIIKHPNLELDEPA